VARFDDHFSQRPAAYAQYRPRYPDELYAYLASIAPNRQRAWDCGTGNGQAAIELVKHFDQVIATDASPQQLAHALPHERIGYWVSRAEAMSLPAASVALVTVAVAVHWFDLESFYREVRRVLAPEGILAVWTYHLPIISPDIDRAVARFYADILSGYWPQRIRYLDQRYTTLPFPFKERTVPRFEMTAEWDLGQLLGFFDSWSAARRYEQAHGHNPIREVWQALSEGWGDPEQKRLVRWPLHLRVGSVS
jgi:SAM-dependent methyltransferase